MDPLSRYILVYYQHLLKPSERKAWNHIIGLEKKTHVTSEKAKKWINKRLCSMDEDVLVLLKDGTDSFFENTRDRILKDHQSEVHMNYCPKCGSLAKTPRAKQCWHCKFDWH
ncbi:MAG: hypothetical protein ACM3ZC_01315 [Bacteroidota bacterium]